MSNPSASTPLIPFKRDNCLSKKETRREGSIVEDHKIHKEVVSIPVKPLAGKEQG